MNRNHFFNHLVLSFILIIISLFIIQGAFLCLFPCSAQAQPTGDYGDAPDGTNTYYPVLSGTSPVTGRFPTKYLTTNSRIGAPGIHHLDTTQEWFGSGSSAEVGASDPIDPDGFMNLVNNDGFDDGLPPIPFFLVLVSLPPQASVTFIVTVAPHAPPGTRYVNMLIDWDRSGDWQDIPGSAPEWALVNYPINVPPGTTQAITAPIAWGLGAVLAPQIFWMRMTLSRSQISSAPYGVSGWDGSGVFSFGETEDFFFHPQVPHSGPPPWNPPPGGFPGLGPLPGIKLVPQSQTVSHGTPAYVYIVSTGGPAPVLEWAVDPGPRGGFFSEPGTGFMPPGAYGPEPSGSTAGVGGGPPPPPGQVPPGSIDYIVVNSIVHPMVPPTEEWPVRVKARWPGIRVQIRKAVVHIIHSGFGPFGLMAYYDTLMDTIENYEIPQGLKDDMLSMVDQSSFAFQTGDIGQALAQLESLRAQVPLFPELTPEQVTDLQSQLDTLIQGVGATGPVPVPQIVTPEDGDTIKGNVSIGETTLSPNVVSNRFEYSIDGNTWVEIGTDYNGADGWSVDWDTTTVQDGSCLIRATMENSGGLQGNDLIYVWVDNNAPEPQFVSPTDGESVSGVLTIQATSDSNEEDIQCTFEISADANQWFEIGKDLDGQDGWTAELDTAQLEDGNYIVKATMVDAAVNEGTSTVRIKIKQVDIIPFNMDLPAGWSMISLPVVPDDALVLSLFPDAVVVYRYEKGAGYVRVTEADTLEAGQGYWILLNEDQSYPLTGESIPEYSLSINEDGWHMIGGCSSEAQAVIDNGSIDVIYRYVKESGYDRVLPSENLEPGEGYWISLSNVVGQAELTVK